MNASGTLPVAGATMEAAWVERDGTNSGYRPIRVSTWAATDFDRPMRS